MVIIRSGLRRSQAATQGHARRAHSSRVSASLALLLVGTLCCQQATSAQAGILGLLFGPPLQPGALQYELTKLSAPLESMCVGSQNASKASFSNPDYLLMGSTITVLDGYTTCASTVHLLQQQGSGSYKTLEFGELPLEWMFAAWKVSNWQAAPTDIVQLNIANRGLVPLLLTSLASLLTSLILPFAKTSVLGPASSFNRNFTTMPAVQSYVHSLTPAPPAGALQAALLLYPTMDKAAYAFYQADATGAISFYLFESSFVPEVFRRRRLLASDPGYSTQGSSCKCTNNPHPAPSCKNGNSAYPGCMYVCNC